MKIQTRKQCIAHVIFKNVLGSKCSYICICIRIYREATKCFKILLVLLHFLRLSDSLSFLKIPDPDTKLKNGSEYSIFKITDPVLDPKKYRIITDQHIRYNPSNLYMYLSSDRQRRRWSLSFLFRTFGRNCWFNL